MNRAIVDRRELRAHRFLGALFVGVALLSGCAAQEADKADIAEDGAPLPHLPREVVESWQQRGIVADRPVTKKEQTQILDYLKTRGVRVSDAVFYAEGGVLVEGDMLLESAKLLKDATSDATKKGYWFGPGNGGDTYDITYYNRISVSWDVSEESLNWGWAFASLTAQNDWTNHTNIHFVSSDPTATLVYKTVHWPSTPGFLAWTEPGHDVTAPGRILINLDYNGLYGDPGPCHVGSILNAPDNVKVRTLVHEIGHSFGFAHVGDGQWIPGTGWSGYDSVMYAGCTDTPHALTDDDINSANTKYWVY